MRNSGIRIWNLSFFVLWWKSFIERREPKEPPRKEQNKRENSEIRYLFLIAFLLSIRNRKIKSDKANHIQIGF